MIASRRALGLSLEKGRKSALINKLLVCTI